MTKQMVFLKKDEGGKYSCDNQPAAVHMATLMLSLAEHQNHWEKRVLFASSAIQSKLQKEATLHTWTKASRPSFWQAEDDFIKKASYYSHQ